MAIDPKSGVQTPTQKNMAILDNHRRLAMLLVTPDLIAHLAVGVLVEVEYNPTPSSATIEAVSYLPEKHLFGVILRDASFERVPEGCQLPKLGAVRYRLVTRENESG